MPALEHRALPPRAVPRHPRVTSPTQTSRLVIHHRPARLFKLLIIVLAVMLSATAPSPAWSALAISSSPLATTNQQPDGWTDPKELEAFLDQYMTEKMQELHIPNASLTIVKDGEIFLSKGYGYADYERNIPVDPQKHVFRIASTSKSFVATAIMQLVDQGKIKLNDDINTYLTNFKLEDIGAQPVTIHDILSHSGGLDDRIYDSYTEDSAELQPLAAWFPANHPRRSTPPGLVSRYSNSGYNLLGYVVQQVSGMPFSQYVAEHIFAPLGMQRSSFEQVLPPALASDLAKRYDYSDGAFQPVPSIYLNEVPAGGMYSTANDMAAYMIAHLQNGRYRDARILSEASAQAMHQQQFSIHPELPGFGYGFYLGRENGQQILLHDGNGPEIASRMLLLPETNTAFFLVQGGGSSRLRADLTTALLDRYYPQTNTQPVAITNGSDLNRFTGFYRLNRYDRTGILKIPTGMMSVRITAEQDGLVFQNPFGDNTIKWVEIAPLLFQSTDGRFHMAFREDAQGHITDMALRLFHLPVDFERVAWYESMNALLVGMLGPPLLFLSAIIVWPIGALIRRLRKRPVPPRPAQYARWVASIVALCGVFMAANLASQDLVFGQVNPLVTPMPVIAALIVINLGALLALALPYFVWRVWRDRYWNLVSRIHYTLIAAAALVFVVVAAYGNILGFNI